MAKQETFKGSMESAYGNKLPKAIAFNGSYEAFENPQEVKDAGEWPSDKDIVDYANTLRKNNARQKAMTEALTAAGITKPDANDPAVVMARMLKDLEKVDLPADQKEMLAAVIRQKQSTLTASNQ